MATVQDLVSRSLRILRVLDSHSAPEAQQMADAMVALNAMMQRWEANGTALGWMPVSNPADVLPIPVEAEEAVAFNLAVKLRPEYGVQMDPDSIQYAREGLAALERDRLTEMPLRLKARTPGSGRYDIYTDSWH